MIIILSDDSETGKGMRALKRIYGASEQVEIFSDMHEDDNYALIKKGGPIRRITFLGHSGSTNRFGPFTSPMEFVLFLERVFQESLAKDDTFLANIETIDLFGCEVGHLIHGAGFVTEVSHLLSEKGYSVKIRAFSHDPEREFEKTTLIQEQVDSLECWEYVGLDAAQCQQYLELKESDKLVSKLIKKINSSIEKNASRLSTLNMELDSNVENISEEWGMRKAEIANEIDEVNGKLEISMNQKEEAKLRLSAIHGAIHQLIRHNIIVPRTSDPRNTVDATSVCHFDSKDLALIAASDSESGAGADVDLDTHSKLSSSAMSSEQREKQAQMKEVMTAGRSDLAASVKANDEKVDSSASMSLGGGVDDT